MRLTMVLKYKGERHDTIMYTLMSYGYKKLESYHLADDIIKTLDNYATATDAGIRQRNEMLAIAQQKLPYWKVRNKVDA